MNVINGIPLQCLNGVDQQDKELKSYATKGYSNNIADEMDIISKGYDFAGYRGDGSSDDEDRIYNHLLRTKKVVDKYPQGISGYQSPRQFQRMLGYVLDNWDTANREAAIDNMAREESRLIGCGTINTNIASDNDEAFYLNNDDVYDENEYAVAGNGAVKRILTNSGFFNQLKKLTTNPALAKQNRELIAANPFFDKYKNKVRSQIAKSRQNKLRSIVDGQIKRAITVKTASVSGLDGVDLNLQAALLGTDMMMCGLGSVSVDEMGIKNYLKRTRKALASNPTAHFDDQEEMEETLGMLDYAINNFSDKKNRDIVLGQLSGNDMGEDEYDEFLEGLANAQKRNKRKKFFTNLKKFSNSKNGRVLKAIITGNPFALIKKKGMGNVDASNFNFNYQALLSGFDFTGSGVSGVGNENIKNYLKRTRAVVAENPELFCDDSYDFENVMGVLGYAIKNFDNSQAIDALCGIGMTDEQYEDFEDTLGALGAKKNKAQKKAEKAQKKTEKKAAKAQKKEKKKAVKAEKKAVRKEKTKQFFAKVKESAKKTGQKIKNAAKKAGKFFKKVVRAIVRFNPISLLIRGGLMMCFQLNMFKLSTKIYPGTMTKEDALKLGLTEAEYEKSKQGYEKVLKIFTKLGGKQEKLLKSMEKGYKKAWKGSEEYSKDAMQQAVDKNAANLQQLVNEDEAELKTKGAIATDDPNITVEETQVEVEEEITDAESAADASVEGLIRNHYCDGLNGLGEIAIAATTASAGGVIASIIAFIKKMGIKADWITRIKDKVAERKNKKELEKSMSDEQKENYSKMNNAEQNAYAAMSTEERSYYDSCPSDMEKNIILQKKVSEDKQAKQQARTETWNNIKQNVSETANNVVQSAKNLFNPQENTMEMQMQQDMNIMPQQPQSNSKKWILIGGAVILLGVGGYFLLRKNEKTVTAATV